MMNFICKCLFTLWLHCILPQALTLTINVVYLNLGKKEELLGKRGIIDQAVKFFSCLTSNYYLVNFFNYPLEIFGLFVNLVFLGQAFTIMLVYVWSRRNPYVRMNFFGLLIFQAPFLPWVLMGFSLLLGNSIIVDLLGKEL